jgi:hypothetical protein
MKTHHFEHLKEFRSKKKLKIANYLSLLNAIEEKENQIITEEFYSKYPHFADKKQLKDLLSVYVERGIVPDENLLISIEEYLQFRVEKC